MDQHLHASTLSSTHHARWMPGIPSFEPQGRLRGGDLSLAELEFRRLRTPGEIAEIQDLRSGIQLPAAALRAADFDTLEKKETRKGLSVHSNGATR